MGGGLGALQANIDSLADNLIYLSNLSPTLSPTLRLTQSMIDSLTRPLTHSPFHSLTDPSRCGRNAHGQLGLGDPATFPVNERNHPFQTTFKLVEVVAIFKIDNFLVAL